MTACGAPMGAIHVVDRSANKLNLVAGEGLPELWRDWTAEIPLRTGIGAGVFGEAAVLRRLAFAPSLDDPKFDGFREVARFDGIGAAWSMPFGGKGQQLCGTLTMLYTAPRMPAWTEMFDVERIGRRLTWQAWG